MYVFGLLKWNSPADAYLLGSGVRIEIDYMLFYFQINTDCISNKDRDAWIICKDCLSLWISTS